jgi:hypothetical protein
VRRESRCKSNFMRKRDCHGPVMCRDGGKDDKGPSSDDSASTNICAS